MKTFKSIEELKPYYNEETNTYEFYENGQKMDVEFKFRLNVDSHIKAWDIKAWDINARDITAWKINAGDIKALDINARDIKAGDINAGDINAGNIKAWDINAWNIKAWDINAWNINYFAVCFAYNSIKCNTIKGRRENARHFVLDGEVEIKPKPKEIVTLELTEK